MATKKRILKIKPYKVYPDIWSFIHFSLGILVTLPFLLSGVSFLYSFLVVFILLTFYEFIEPRFWPNVMGHSYSEKFPNAVSDVVVGMMGFFVAWYVSDLKLNLLLFFLGIAIFWIYDILTTKKYVKLVKEYIERKLNFLFYSF